jgi:hypothetical protein
MRTRILVILVFAVILVIGAAGYAIGLYSYERHSGFFAPVWDDTGKTAFVLQRETRGFVWGLGWEFFSPPASSYVLSDSFALLRVSPGGKDPVVVAHWSGSPLTGRVTQHYRGRIFNTLYARLDPSDEGIRIRVRMNIPRVPSSEIWSIDATWKPQERFEPHWRENAPGGGLAGSEAALKAGRELITVPGRESFNAAVAMVDAGGSYSILIENGQFDALYPKGIPAKLVAERSRRKQIEKIRDFRKVQADLVSRFMSEEGLSEGDATLRAYDEMEKLGYLPRTPRIKATPLQQVPANVRVFDIPGRYLEAGLFQDIAEAIKSPGTAVKTGLGSYLAYNEDDLGPRLKAFRQAGGNRFAVRIEGRLFLIEQDRP